MLLSSGGTLDLEELKRGFKRLKSATQASVRAEKAERARLQPVEAIRVRAKAAREAVASADKADKCDEQLASMRQDYAARLDLQLGDFLVQRGINLAEIVKSWAKPRGNHNAQHANEVSMEEFKDEITLLGLQVAIIDYADVASARGPTTRAVTAAGQSARTGSTARTPREARAGVHGTARRKRGNKVPQRLQMRPATRKEVGALFTQIDTDCSGWISLKEVREKLKSWQSESRTVIIAQQEKEKEINELRRRATRMLQAAVRIPERKDDLIEEPTSSTAPPPRGRTARKHKGLNKSTLSTRSVQSDSSGGSKSSKGSNKGDRTIRPKRRKAKGHTPGAGFRERAKQKRAAESALAASQNLVHAPKPRSDGPPIAHRDVSRGAMEEVSDLGPR